MGTLELLLLGPPRVRLNGELVDFRRRKALALLVYLAVTGQPHSRDTLATLFYPDNNQSQARGYLRRDLAVLNTTLGSRWFETDRERIRLKLDGDLRLDVTEFRACLDLCQSHNHNPETPCVDCLPNLSKAVELYADDFLTGFTLRDCPEFDDWHFFQAEGLRQELAATLERLVRGCVDHRQPEIAVPHARRWVALDPLHEPAQRSLIQLYDRAGQVSAALRQYEEYTALLEEELGLPPEEETTTIYEAIKAKRKLGTFLKTRTSKVTGPSKPAAPESDDALPALHPIETHAPPISAETESPVAPSAGGFEQEIRFCTTSDRVRIAYATSGKGPVLVKAANWLSHVEYDWQSPVWRHWLTGLAQSHTLVRYDRRGCGLSDWEVDDFSLSAYVKDLEAVVETLGLTRFPLLGLSGGGPVAIAYTARHPEKVSHLILFGSYVRGRLCRSQIPEQIAEGELLLQIMNLGWGKANPAFRQIYTSLFIPEGTAEQINWFNDLQRISTSPEIAVRMFEATFTTDASDLAARLTVPTLILHGYNDAVVPFEESRYLAALIPSARFVPLESKNHILLEDEPAWQQFLDETHRFLGVTEDQPLPERRSEEETVEIRVSSPTTSEEASTPSAHNLPSQLTPFIGRQRELAELRNLLTDPDHSLITLTGPGGIGKTRLALEAAAAEIKSFQDGVYFVPLAPVDSGEAIVPSVAEAIGFRFYEGRDPEQQLLDHLHHKQILLVMDNFEHILSGRKLVMRLLEAAQPLKILSTSRERLNLTGERVYTLGGLSFPGPEVVSGVLEFDAAKLLLHRAKLIRSDFAVQPADLVHITRICQLTQGMPLAIVLATSWLDVLSLKEIAAEIDQSLDFLETEMQDVPERQRSVWAVFDSSWKLLSAEERCIFMRLSVFRGGFSRKAAQAVTGAGLHKLRSLVNKSLVSLTRQERFDIHELLRQYGEQQLAAADEKKSTRDAHSAYFLDALHQHEADLKSNSQIAALNQIEANIENIRSAWNWAIRQDRLEAIDQALESLYMFYSFRGRFQEGQEAFSRAAESLQIETAASDSASTLLLAKLLIRQGAFCHALGLHQQSKDLLDTGLSMAQQLKAQKEIAFSFRFLGDLIFARARLLEAKALYQDSLRISREIADQLGMADSLRRLGWTSTHLNDYSAAKEYYQESLVWLRQADHKIGIAYTLDKLGINAWYAGDYTESERHYRESLSIFKELDDKFGIAMALGGLGLVIWSGQDAQAEEGLKQFKRSLALCRETGHQLETANRLLIISWILNSQKMYHETETYSQEALELAKKIGYKHGITIAFNNLGEAACGQADFQLAREYLYQALELAIRVRRVDNVLNIITNLALVFAREDTTPAGDRKKELAVEILSLSSGHRAAWQIIRDKAAVKLAELETELSPKILDSARSSGKHKLLDEILDEVWKNHLGSRPGPLLSFSSTGKRFIQERLIASGGMGEIYRGRDTRTGQPVAIKRLRPEIVNTNPGAIQRLLREAETLRQLDHPNIVKILGTYEADDQPVLVMEYVPGGSLRNLLDQQPHLSLSRAVAIALELADALTRVHHLGIIHRDITPANVLLTEDGSPRLTDFGVAFLLQQDTQLTTEGTILGTSAYLSPEAWRGEPLDERSDIWSFGALLFELLAGRAPFEGKQIVVIMTKVLHDPLPDLSQIRPDAPPALIDLINQMLTKEREQRIDSMRHVAARLEMIQRGLAHSR